MNTGNMGIFPISPFAAVIIIPPGASSAQLQTAINGAASGDIIQISSDMSFTSVVTVPLGLEITILSDDGNNWVLTQTVASARHFTVNGTLMLQDITLNGADTGGGIVVSGTGSLILNNGSTVTHSRIANGGVYLNNGSLTLNGGAISLNASTTGGGGGVYMANGSSLTMNSGSISGNAAATANGGGVFMTGTGGTSLIINGGSIDNNTAVRGGGVYVNQGHITMTGGAIENNRATGGNGGGVCLMSVSASFTIHDAAITGNTASNNGGGIYSEYTNISITRSAVSGNQSGAAVALTGGGGIYATLCNVEITESEFSANTASRYGGGINVLMAHNLVIIGCSFTENTGTAGGGGLLVNQCPQGVGIASISNCTIDGNNKTATASGGIGGGLYVSNSTLTIEDSSVDDNMATGSGGGLYVFSSTLTMEGSTILDNTSGNGGGFYEVTSMLALSDVHIDRNTASGSGGGLYLNSASASTTNELYLYGSTVDANTSTSGSGGGIYAGAYCFVAISESSVSRGTAGDSGGGIYVLNSSSCSIENGSIDGNTAANAGGGIYLNATGTLVVYGTSYITNNNATAGNGGGIFTGNYDYSNPASTSAYQNIMTAPETIFYGNHAIAAFFPPNNASDFINIGYTTTSLSVSGVYVHPLNNYDINYMGPRPLEFFSVFYDANGGTGSYTSGSLEIDTVYTVLSPDETGITRPGYTFAGWNTEPDGSAAAYQPGDTFTITGNTVLYAQWVSNSIPERPCCCMCNPCCCICNLCCPPVGNCRNRR